MNNGLQEPLCISNDFTGFTKDIHILVYTRVTVNYICPCLATLVLCIKTIKKLRKNSDDRNTLGVQTNSEVERQTTIYLLFSSIAFIFFTLPEGMALFVMIFVAVDENLANILITVSTTLVLFRSGANLLMYFVTSSHFRNALQSNMIILLSKVKTAFSRSGTESSSVQSSG